MRGQQQEDTLVGYLIYSFLFAAVISLLCLLTACSPRVVETVRTETSTVVEYKDRVVYKDTTVYVQVPVESHSQSVAPGDSSRLETSLAESRAWVDSAGLHHTLRNKEGRVPFEIKYPTRTIVASAVQSSRESIIKEKLIDKPLTKWQKFQIWGFRLVVLAAIGFLLYRYRDKVFPLLRKALGLLKFI